MYYGGLIDAQDGRAFQSRKIFPLKSPRVKDSRKKEKGKGRLTMLVIDLVIHHNYLLLASFCLHHLLFLFQSSRSYKAAKHKAQGDGRVSFKMGEKRKI